MLRGEAPVVLHTRNIHTPRARTAALVCGVALAALCAATASIRASSVVTPPHVVIAEYDGIIHPIAVELVGDLLARAEATDAAAAVLVLRTPGGLLDSTRAIVSQIIAAKTPVIVFVGPSGARAASGDSPCRRCRGDGSWHTRRCRASGWRERRRHG
jgi:membrane-bound ClpP family serine protease